MGTPAEAGEPQEFEEFGVHKLLLSSDNISGYKDVHFLKNRKKRPWQAKVWRPWAKDHINLGCASSNRRRRRLRWPLLELRDSGASKAQTKAALRTVRCPALPFDIQTLLCSSTACCARADREAKARRDDKRRRSNADHFPRL